MRLSFVASRSAEDMTEAICLLWDRALINYVKAATVWLLHSIENRIVPLVGDNEHNGLRNDDSNQ
jgi:hypothetical protein